MSFQIETNIPVQASRANYPFARMRVGDSFLADGPDAKKVQVAAYKWAKVNQKKMLCRNVEGGIRIWRIA